MVLLKHKEGQALIVVITFLVMFSLIGIAFFALSQAERRASIRNLNNVRARYLAEAGVAYAQKVLDLDRRNNLIDSLEDITFTHFQGEDVDLDKDGENESKWFNVLDSHDELFGRFSIRVLDEASKININVCTQETLERLFSQLTVESSKAGSLLAGRPLNAVEEIGSILSKDEFKGVKDFITIYSRDREIDLERKRRPYLNTASSRLILEAFLNRGVKNAYQKAANLKDAQDTDLSQTMLYKFSLTIRILPPYGFLETEGTDWAWDEIGRYFQAPAGGSSGKFIWLNLPVEDGDYFCFIYGPGLSDVVGEVEGQYILSGEGLVNPVTVTDGALALNISSARDSISRLSHIELVSMYPRGGLNRKVVTGTEGLVINEVMAKPWQEITVSLPDINSGETLTHTFTGIKSGNYYLAVLAKNEGGLVGDVSTQGRTATNLRDGDYFPYTILVGSSGQITVDIENNSLTETATLKGIIISQQPDSEFIEILNLSPQEIDLSDFFFEVYSSAGELIAGWPGRIPEGINIRPFQHLTFSVDDNDGAPSPVELRGNSISFRRIWGFNSRGLIFEDYLEAIDKSFDLLPDSGASVILKDSRGKRIDGIEYQDSQVKDFVSLERPDPTLKEDSDGDGLFDGWYTCEDYNKGTPNLTNENIGMYTSGLIKHAPSEIKLFNRQLSGLAEVQELSSGENWENFSLTDLARICDAFAYEAKELDLLVGLSQGDSEIWEFTNIPTGTYWLTLESNIDSEGCRLLVAYKKDSEEEFGSSSAVVVSDGVANFGNLELEGEKECNLQLRIINDSDKNVFLKRAILEPIVYKPGRINVNTAEPEVLTSLLGSADLTQKILSNRPLGNNDERRLGIGELLLLDSAFLTCPNLLTVKSDVFEILSGGEYISSGNTMASQVIRTVIQRGE